MRTPTTLAVGTRLGPYEVIAPLGAGGMGEVYRARDPRLSRDVAIKILPGELGASDEAIRLFEREARAVAALSHPNILAIHDVGRAEGQIYAVMELLEGETLRTRLRRGALPWRKAVAVTAAVADGLSAAHAKGIVHRDLKPENIFLMPDGRVKVLDFGLAKRLGSPDDQSAASASPTQSWTESGRLVGTLGYMSPEQVRCLPLDPRSDLFAVGCVLHEMISGRRPFSRQTAAQTIFAILNDEPEHLRGIPRELQRIIDRCLEKDPGPRFQSAGDLSFNLRACLDSSPMAEGRHASNLRWRHHRMPILSAAAASVMAVTAAAWLWVATPPDSRLPPVPSALPVARPATAAEENTGRTLRDRARAETTSGGSLNPLLLRIEHDAVGCLIAGEFPLITAAIRSGTKALRARVYFRAVDGTDYYYVVMAAADRHYTGKLPRPKSVLKGVSYHIAAYSPDGTTVRTQEVPAVVVPHARECPKGSRVADLGPPGKVTVFSAAIPGMVLTDVLGLHAYALMLDDPNDSVRRAAADALRGQAGSVRDAIAKAVADLASSLDDGRRLDGAQQLSAIAGIVVRDGLQPLMGALGARGNGARAHCARAIGELGPPIAEARRALQRGLHDGDPKIRAVAVESMGSIGPVVARLLVVLDEAISDPDATVSRAAIEARDRLQSQVSER